MRPNPYDPPKHFDSAVSRWRSRWRRVCLGGLCSAGVFLAASQILTNYGRQSTQDSLFTIANGLLALGELTSWMMVGVGAIGWITCRLPPGATKAP